jgi:hypothetical protein
LRVTRVGFAVRNVDSDELWLLTAAAVVAWVFFIGMLMMPGSVGAA